VHALSFTTMFGLGAVCCCCTVGHGHLLLGVYYGPPLAENASTDWTLFLEGGGWCYDEVRCRRCAG